MTHHRATLSLTTMTYCDHEQWTQAMELLLSNKITACKILYAFLSTPCPKKTSHFVIVHIFANINHFQHSFTGTLCRQLAIT